MKTALNIITRGSLYATLISFLMFVLIGLSGVPDGGMYWHRFLLIVCYGILISFTQWITDVIPLKRVWRRVINFFTNLVLFFIAYIIIEASNGFNIGRALIFVGIFVVLYFAIILGATIVNRLIKNKTDTESDFESKKSEQVYRPRYSDED